jgi:hypothetical protein
MVHFCGLSKVNISVFQEAVKETILELETLSLTPAEERSAGDTAAHTATPVTNGLSRESIEGR